MSREQNRFEGSVAIVAGASKGIGRAVAAQLASEGAAVMLNARKPEDLAAAEAELGELGGNVASVAASAVDEGGAEEIVAATVEKFGPIDLIVNIVGVNTFHGPILEISRGKFERTMVGNTWPLIALIQAGLGNGLERGGSVVGVSSIGARQVQPLLAHYSAAKVALEALIRHLARDLGPQGIRVNGVAPGLVATDMSKILWEGPTGDAEAAMLPMQRLGQPQDIANTIAFLLSAEADWLTGMTIDVDGGRMLIGGEPRELIGQYGKPSEG